MNHQPARIEAEAEAKRLKVHLCTVTHISLRKFDPRRFERNWVDFFPRKPLQAAAVFQGLMLWSQFSAIFDNFQRKNGVFLKNQCYDQIFHNLALFWVKNANLVAEFFCENI
jgi:hypothetical protein